MKNIVLISFSIVCLLPAMFLLGSAFNIRPVEANGTIYIRATGEVEGTNKIQRDGDIYNFTDNINDEIVVERNDIIIDGNGYTLQGTWTVMDPSKGMDLSGRNNVTIKNMKIKGFWDGIWLEYSHNNTISENDLIGNREGISIWYSFNNIILGNNITEGDMYGVALWSSSNNLLRNNHMSDNQYNFNAPSSPNFVNDVDVSNTVDGKPVYYWIDEHDKTVPHDAGYVALVNCTHMTVENLSLTNNGDGVLLVNTNNSKIINNNMANNFYGIYLYKSSSNNTISGNSITNNTIGVDLYSNNTVSENNIANNPAAAITLGLNSNNIIISGNNITNSQLGIQFMGSSNNTIYGNNIANNKWGIQLNSSPTLGYSSNNTICHNNFINNTKQVWVLEIGDIPPSAYTNFWDDGYPSGGNYWSNYTGVDSNHDGIGDSEHVLNANNQDNYPLMGSFYDFEVTVEHGEVYHVHVVSNSTVQDLRVLWWLTSPNEYLQPGQKFIQFFVVGEENATGFCRVTIPRTVLNGTYIVLVDWDEVSANELAASNTTHAYLYFTYQHSTHEVIIVPEFPSLLILPLFMISTLLAVILYRRKHCA